MFPNTQVARMEKWIKISHHLASKFDVAKYSELLIGPRLQNMGSLDCFLLDEERWYKKRDLKDWSDESIARSNRLFYLSFLWVLDAYELLRVLKTPEAEGGIPRSGTFDNTDESILTDLESALSKVRIPLVKYQPKSKKTPFEKQDMLISHDGQIGWLIRDKTLGYKEFLRTVQATLILGELENMID